MFLTHYQSFRLFSSDYHEYPVPPLRYANVFTYYTDFYLDLPLFLIKNDLINSESDLRIFKYSFFKLIV
jgi:hypothetical protein